MYGTPEFGDRGHKGPSVVKALGGTARATGNLLQPHGAPTAQELSGEVKDAAKVVGNVGKTVGTGIYKLADKATFGMRHHKAAQAVKSRVASGAYEGYSDVLVSVLEDVAGMNSIPKVPVPKFNVVNPRQIKTAKKAFMRREIEKELDYQKGLRKEIKVDKAKISGKYYTSPKYSNEM